MRLLFPVLAALALAACGDSLQRFEPAVPSSPAVIADATAIDEKAQVAIESAYAAALIAVEAAVDSGLLQGEQAGRVIVLKRSVDEKMAALRSAYDAVNAPSWWAAYGEALPAVLSLRELASSANVGERG